MIHGSGFEFLRDDSMNARDPFAAIGPDGERRSDGLNRNQFGGSLGGPMVRDQLFYFAAYQRTRVRRIPTSGFQFMPTAAMLAGDFTAFASPQCQAGRQIDLRAPFVNNRVSPTLFSPASLKVVSLLGVIPDNPCGQVFFDRVDNNDEDLFTAKVDYNRGGSHSIFGRLQYQKYDSPTDHDGKTAFSFSQSAFKNRVYAPERDRRLQHRSAWRAADPYPDVDLPGRRRLQHRPRGAHQFGFGANYIHNKYGSSSLLAAGGNTTFTGAITSVGLADFLLGRAASCSAGTPTGVHVQNHYFGVYAQDSWPMLPNLTLSVGLRWDPYFPVYSAEGRAGGPAGSVVALVFVGTRRCFFGSPSPQN